MWLKSKIKCKQLSQPTEGTLTLNLELQRWLNLYWLHVLQKYFTHYLMRQAVIYHQMVMFISLKITIHYLFNNKRNDQ